MSATTLYRMYDEVGDLLYVGICANPRRLDEHKGSKDWWQQVDHIAVSHFPDRTAARAAEFAAIRDIDPTITEIRRLIDSIGGRLDKIVAALDALPAPACTGQRYDVNPDAPEEGTDVRHDTPCPVHVDLGWATGGNTAVLTTMPVADVPVDGSVEVRPVGDAGRFGPWVHVIGEAQRAVGGEDNRSLLVDGVAEPFTWHLDQCVQVRPFRPVDEDAVEARHRAETGGL